MSLPKTRAELETAGYKVSNYGRCSGCRAAIEWWTTPIGARAPMNPMPHPESEVISHFATCPNANQFRKPAKRAGV